MVTAGACRQRLLLGVMLLTAPVVGIEEVHAATVYVYENSAGNRLITNKRGDAPGGLPTGQDLPG